jgi:hypothetical protein
MANQHSVAASAVTIVTTTETVIATLGPFNENQVAPAQGIAFDGNINMTVGTGGTAVTVRVRQGTAITGTLVGVAQAQTATAGNTINLPIGELDPTLIQVNAQYVVTVQQTAASGNGTVNRVIFSCQDAVPFE